MNPTIPEMSPLRRRVILIVLALCVLAVTMDMSILNVALTTIQRQLHTTSGDLQWAVDAYLVTFAAFIFTGGVTADRFGRKKTLIGALALFGASSALAGLSTGVTSLVIWRAVMGVGAAALPTITLAILLNIYPPTERPKAIAVWAGAASVGSVMGPVAGGILLQFFWWGSILMVNVPICIIAIAVIAQLVPESRNPKNNRFDPIGVAISVVAVASLVYGIVHGGEHNDWLTLGTLGPIVLGILLAALLVFVESRMEKPSLDMSLLKAARFSAGTFAIGLAFFALLGGGFVTSVYLQGVRGLEPIQAGLLTIPMGLGGFLISFRIPKLVKRFGPRSVVVTGTLAMTITYIIYSTISSSIPLWVFALAQFLLGLGWGSVMAPSTGALMSVVPPEKAGAGQVLPNTARQVMGALGVAIVGSVLGVGYRSTFGSSGAALPDSIRGSAGTSIGSTINAIHAAGSQIDTGTAAQIKAAANHAYMSGMRPAMILCAVAALAASSIAFRWLPNKPPAPAVPPAAAPAAPVPVPATGPEREPAES